MKLDILALPILAGAAVTNRGSSVCPANNCNRAVTGTQRGPSWTVTASHDCASILNYPASPTVTVGGTTVTVTTTYVDFKKRDAAATPSLVNGIPAYASACKNIATYASACSCLGVASTATTVTIPTVTVTTSQVSVNTADAKQTYFLASLPATLVTTNLPNVSPTATFPAPYVSTSTIGPPITVPPLINPTPAYSRIPAASSTAVHFVAPATIPGDESVFWTNVTFDADGGPPVVNLEEVGSFASFSCGANTITMVFNDTKAAAAAATWPRTFGLITSGSALCGIDGQRSYFKVTALTKSPKASPMTFVLTTTPAMAQDIAKRFAVNWGVNNQAPPQTLPPSTSNIQRRDGSDSVVVLSRNETIALAAERHANYVKKRDDVGYSPSMDAYVPWGAFLEGYAQGSATFQDSDWSLTNNDPEEIDCDSCGLYASMSIFGGIETIDGDALTVVAGISLTNMWFVTFVDIHVDKTLNVNKLYDLGRVYFEGIKIPDVITIAPYAAAGIDIKISAGAFIDIEGLGFQFAQGDSTYAYDFIHEQPQSNVGQPASFTILTPQISVAEGSDIEFASLDVSISIGPELGFEFDAPLVQEDDSITFYVRGDTPKYEATFSVNDDYTYCTGDPSVQGGSPSFDYALNYNFDIDIGTSLGRGKQWNVYSSPWTNIIPAMINPGAEYMCVPVTFLG